MFSVNRTLLLTFCLSLCAVPSDGADAPLIELGGPEVLASDLLPEWAGIDVALAKSPMPGAVRRVPRAELARWATRAGLDAQNFPEALLLRRRTRAVGPEEIVMRLAGALAEQTGRPSSQIEVELLSYGRPQVPDGDLRFAAGGPFRTLNRPARFSLRWSEPGGRSGVLSVEAVLRVRAKWLEARRDLHAGTPARPEDFTLAEGEMENAHAEYVSSFDELSRKRFTRLVRAGAPVPRLALADKPDVERGDVVELEARVGAVRLRIAARAEGSGSAGDVVAFRNLESGSRVTARVLNEKTAEVIAR